MRASEATGKTGEANRVKEMFSDTVFLTPFFFRCIRAVRPRRTLRVECALQALLFESRFEARKRCAEAHPTGLTGLTRLSFAVQHLPTLQKAHSDRACPLLHFQQRKLPALFAFDSVKVLNRTSQNPLKIENTKFSPDLRPISFLRDIRTVRCLDRACHDLDRSRENIPRRIRISCSTL
jgi:hypothetical protein